MSKKGKFYPIKATCGPIEPFNERLRLKLLVSEKLKQRSVRENRMLKLGGLDAQS